jgi:secondary thiamine-phosphate synthase enzyme
MEFYQKEIRLKPFKKGFHLITNLIVESFPEIKLIETGLLNIFLKHTSASLTINENADPSVRSDMNKFFNKVVPENEPNFDHNFEGPDDMPAHIKSTITGCELNIPITNGKLNLGTWQGIYFCEHRNEGGSRSIVMTLSGSKKM